MAEQQEDLARLISREEGKVLAEGRIEAGRAMETLDLSADAARDLHGETVPLDATPGGVGKLGFTLRVPCGIVAAITPFNFPLNLVAHKIGPAIAGGNAVLLKPASDTPLSALKLVELLLEAGLPRKPSLVSPARRRTGRGDLCRCARAQNQFHWQRRGGRGHYARGRLKRVTMELGSNSPVIVLDDADVAKVARTLAVTGYANAGQVCISSQRVIATPGAHADLLDALRTEVQQLVAGDPLAEGTQVGPLIRERDAARVETWLGEAVTQGAELLCGGSREGAVVQPALLANVAPEMKLSCEELFGPALGVTRAPDVESAIALANETRFGLSAAVFTQDIDRAMRFAREVDSGNLHINFGTAWRAEIMPYGGLKDSGFGKEGPAMPCRK